MLKIKMLFAALLAFIAAFFSQVAMAVDSAEVTAAKAQITQTQTDWTSILGLILLMCVAAWGLYKLIKVFGGR